MPRSHCKNSNNIKDEASLFSPEPISPGEMFDNENCLDETQDKDLKRTTTNFIQEFKEFKKKAKKQLIELKETALKEAKCLREAEETQA